MLSQAARAALIAAGLGATALSSPALAQGKPCDRACIINNRPIVAADLVTGIAIGFSQFRYPFAKHINGMYSERNAENMKYKPFDMPAAHIFKIGADGLVHEIEAVGFTAPYKSPTGWETR